MKPFDFVVTFFSFVFSLALAHLLLAIAHMIRHRREIVFDWAQALWMAAALVLLITNWIDMWDLHTVAALPLAVVAVGFLFLITQYVACALVSPRLDGEDGMDMHRFHEQQGQAYIGSMATVVIFAIAANLLAGTGINMTDWMRENAFVIAMLPAVIAPLIWRARWVQISAPIAFIALLVAVLVTIHPALR